MINTEALLYKVFKDYYVAKYLESEIKTDEEKKTLQKFREEHSQINLSSIRARIKRTAKFLDDNGYVFNPDVLYDVQFHHDKHFNEAIRKYGVEIPCVSTTDKPNGIVSISVHGISFHSPDFSIYFDGEIICRYVHGWLYLKNLAAEQIRVYSNDTLDFYKESQSIYENKSESIKGFLSKMGQLGNGSFEFIEPDSTIDITGMRETEKLDFILRYAKKMEAQHKYITSSQPK